MSRPRKSDAVLTFLEQWKWALDSRNGPSEKDLLSMFKVEAPDGRLVPFELNIVQEEIHRVVERMEEMRKPVRIIVLKGRQMGVSTYSDGRLLAKVIRIPGQKCLIMAHKEADTEELFQSKVSELYRQIPPSARPVEEVFTKRELEVRPAVVDKKGRKRFLGRSNIRALTAGSDRVGRSWTFQHIHLSEAAFFRRADEVWGALAQTVHHEPGTSIIIESTANGAGGFFYETWKGAVEGKNGYVPLFFPWFHFPKYQKPFESEEERRKFEESLETSESEMRRRFGLSLEQVNWYRWCLWAKCGGDKLRRMVEYPSTAEEAFILSGTSRFDPASLMALEKRAPQARFIGKIRRSAARGWVKREDPADPEIILYREPEPGREYIIGVDVGNGVGDGLPYKERPDFSAAVVRDRRTRKLMARVHRRIDALRLAQVVGTIGRWYNDALVVVEKNGPGVTCLKYLARGGYPRLYRETRPDDAYGKITDRYGFSTTVLSRESALEALASEIARGRHELSVEQVAECRAFVLNQNGKWEARSGWHDDEVMADAILALINFETPFEEEEPKEKPKKPKSRLERYEERMRVRLGARDPSGGVDPVLGTQW